MESKKYATPAAFRRVLEDRLQAIAKKEGVDLQRLRRQVAFDRLLARLFQGVDPKQLPWVLKGGYAMELRMKAARSTKDIDLTMRSVFGPAHTKGESEKQAILTRLQDIAARKCRDFFFTRSVSPFLIWMPCPTVVPGIRWNHGSMAAFLSGSISTLELAMP